MLSVPPPPLFACNTQCIGGLTPPPPPPRLPLGGYVINGRPPAHEWQLGITEKRQNTLQAAQSRNPRASLGFLGIIASRV